MYVTTEDLKTFLDEREIAALKRDYETDEVDKLESGLNYAINYVKDRLSPYYDMETELAKTPTIVENVPTDPRSTTLMEIISHIAIWKLAITFPTVQLDGKRDYNYKEAMSNLDLISKGKLLATLPPLASGTTTGIVYGHGTENELIY